MRKEDERMDTWREGGMDQQTYGWIRLGPEKCKVKKLVCTSVSSFLLLSKSKAYTLVLHLMGYQGPTCQVLEEDPKKATTMFTGRLAQQGWVPL